MPTWHTRLTGVGPHFSPYPMVEDHGRLLNKMNVEVGHEGVGFLAVCRDCTEPIPHLLAKCAVS